jgi:hypothetical protein
MNATMHHGHDRAPAAAHEPGTRHAGHNPYARLAAMIGLSFLAMFVLMYAMVDTLANAVPNVNQVWMAGLMAAPMLVIEVVLMRAMYPNRTANMVVVALGVVLTLAFFVAIRQQSGIGDRQFLKSMIPHHAGAVLMCREASIADPDIVRLCATIVASQQAEIEQMKALLAREDAMANAEPKR